MKEGLELQRASAKLNVESGSVLGPRSMVRQTPRGRSGKIRTVVRDQILPTSLCELMLALLMVSLFIPEAIAADLSGVKLTPAFAISIVLFPLLVLEARLRLAWPDLLIAVMFISFFASTAMSSPLGRTFESMGRFFLMCTVPYMAGRYLFQDIRRMSRIFKLFVTLLAVMGLLAIFESLYRFNIHSVIWNVPYDPHKDRRLGLTRAHGWTTHAIMFGMVNAAFLPIILVSVWEKINLVGRLVWVKLFALTVGCFLSLSTGAWGPAFLAFLFVLWDYYAPLGKKLVWPITFFTLISGYVLLEVVATRPLLRILMMKLHITSSQAWHYRWLLYERVFEVMPGHWWFGHGLDVPESFRGFQSSIDNNFLVLLLTYGRIGLFLWIALSISVLLYGGKAVWATKTITPTVRLTRAMSFSLIGLLLTQLSVALFSTPATIYWLLMGLIISGSFQCRKEQRQIKRNVAKKRAIRERNPVPKSGAR